MFKYITTCFLAVVTSAQETTVKAPNMNRMLNDMAKHYDEEGEVYDPYYYNELIECFEKYNDTQLVESQDNAWQ